jgi:hypothetical protein
MMVTLILLLSVIIFETIMMKYLGWGDWKVSFFDSLIANVVSSISTSIFVYIPGLKYAASLDGFMRPAAIVLIPAIILLGVVISILIKVCILLLVRRQPLPKLLWAVIITANSISYITYFWLVAAGVLRLKA